MKRLISLFTFFILTLSSYAYDVQVDGIYYNLNHETKDAEVTYLYFPYLGSDSNSRTYSGAIIIPETITSNGIEYQVTSIGDHAFANCSGLTSVTIPNSVTSIGDFALANCSGLTSVAIPNSVTSIGDFALDNCSGLTSVTIPNSVTSIGDGAFYKCSGLTSVTIPNSVTSIGDSAFYGCTSLPVVDNIRYADTYLVVAVDREQREYNIKDGTRFVGSAAFYGCSGLTSVTIPNSVTSIGNYAFEDCSGLTSFAIPDGVTNIGYCVFRGCTGLTYIKIGNSVTEIKEGTFSGCSGLTSVTIGNSVTRIESNAFRGCSSLAYVNITDIAAWCKIEFGDDNCNPLNEAHHLYLNGEEVKDLNIPNSVTSIGPRAFEYCYSLTSVIIPNSVTSIDYYAFRHCDNLEAVYCYAEKVPETAEHAFYDFVYTHYPTENVNLYVPVSSINLYKTARPWCLFGRILPISSAPDSNDTVVLENETQQYYNILGQKQSKPSSGFRIISTPNGIRKQFVR